MSYTNGTPFLNLPQTIGSDHRDWFDTNEAFLDLDTKVKTLWDDSGSAASAIDALEELTATLQSDLTSLEGTVDTHTSALSTINEALVLINGTLSTLDTNVKTKFDSAGIADPYDAAHGIYSVGAVVTYNGQRYVCNTAVTAAEPFDADKWTAEDVQSVINPIKSALSVKAPGYTWNADNNAFYSTAENPNSTMRIRSRSNVVAININLISKGVLSEGIEYTIATIPENYRPAFRIINTVNIYSGVNLIGIGKLNINNGVIIVIFDNVQTHSEAYLQGEVMYILE